MNRKGERLVRQPVGCRMEANAHAAACNKHLQRARATPSGGCLITVYQEREDAKLDGSLEHTLVPISKSIKGRICLLKT